MDNLTHSLAGALLGQAGLKRLSGRSMPTLIIAANLPDIDALTTLLGTPSLALRRGLTTVAQPSIDKGRRAGRLLNQPPRSGLPVVELIETELIRGRTAGPPS